MVFFWSNFDKKRYDTFFEVFGFFPKTPCFLAVNMGYTGPNSKGDHLGFPRVLGQIYSVFFWGFFGTGFCEKRGESGLKIGHFIGFGPR